MSPRSVGPRSVRWSVGVRAVGSLVVVVLAGVGILPALGQVSDEELTEAEQQLLVAQAEVDDLAARYEDAQTRQAELETEAARLDAAARETKTRLEEARALVRERAVDMYIAASGSQLSVLFLSGSPTEVETGLGYLSELGSSDRALLNDLETLKAELERRLAAKEQAEAEQAEVTAGLEALSAELTARLGEIQATFSELLARRRAEDQERRRLAEEEARLEAEAAARTSTTTAPVGANTTTTTVSDDPAPAGGSGARYCPVAGFVTFTDTFGDPRSGGRTHQGVDMLAARGTPTVAVEAGVIEQMSTSALGGITVWLRGDSGDEYYYAHLDGWAGGLSEGSSVGGGEVIGYVGTSGNAPETVPHLHFELHPGGGPVVNPYPLAKRLCG